MKTTQADVNTISVQSGDTVDFRWLRLREKWAALKKIMSPDSAILWAAEWNDLETELGEPLPVPENPVLPPAIPMDFPHDPKNVEEGVVVKKCFNKRLWLVKVGDKEADLWCRKDTFLRIGQTVYLRPNPDQTESGWVLHGEYNKYGDRLR